MSNGATAASGVAKYRVVRELGSRTLRCYAAIREPRELVVLQRFADAKAAVRTDGATVLGAEEVTQLVRDARCLAKNWHPNIARVNHVDFDGSDVMLATELVDGMTLGALFAASTGAPVLPLAVIVRIVVDVLAGLNALHGLRDGTGALGTIHGELCPANIIVGKDGVARLVNCLRARPVLVVARSEALPYAAPEALDNGGSSDVRSDIYGAGLILWEALMGLRPYEVSEPAQLLARQRSEEVSTPVLDESSPFAKLGAIAMRAIAFEPSLRYRTAADMATALRTLAGSLIAPGSVVAATVTELAGDRIRQRRLELDPAAAARRGRSPSSSARLLATAPVTKDAAWAVGGAATRTEPIPSHSKEPASVTEAVAAKSLAESRSGPESATAMIASPVAVAPPKRPQPPTPQPQPPPRTLPLRAQPESTTSKIAGSLAPPIPRKPPPPPAAPRAAIAPAPIPALKPAPIPAPEPAPISAAELSSSDLAPISAAELSSSDLAPISVTDAEPGPASGPATIPAPPPTPSTPPPPIFAVAHSTTHGTAPIAPEPVATPFAVARPGGETSDLALESPPPPKPRRRGAAVWLVGAAIVLLLVVGFRAIFRADPPPIHKPVAVTAGPTATQAPAWATAAAGENANANDRANANANANANENANENASAKTSTGANGNAATMSAGSEDAGTLSTGGPPPTATTTTPPAASPPTTKGYEPLGI